MDNGLRDLYDTFLDSGELMSILPEAKGIWEKDKKMFENIHSTMDVSIPVVGKVYEDDDEEEDFYIEEDYPLV